MSAMDKDAARKADEALLTSEARKLWQSIDEKNASVDLVHQQRGQEFHELPKDAGADEKCEDLNRRDFFKWVGGASALLATGCQQRPTRHLVPYVNKPAGWTYGVPVWFASVSPQGQGVLVKTREGRPIKLEGNPDHQMNRGGLDVSAQAEILNLYNPERLRGPLDVKSGNEMSWAQVREKVLPALESARRGGVRLLTAPVQSPSLQASIDQFAKKYSAQHETYSALSYASMARAYEVATGSRRIPYLDFSKADVVVSIDADFLGTWLRPVDFTKQFSERRKIHDGDTNVNQFFSFESMMSITGAAADYRYSIKPSMQLEVALTLINELSASVNFDAGIRASAEAFTAARLASSLGVEESQIDLLVSRLRSARGKSLVVGGCGGPQSLELQLACIALNQALGNFGETVLWSSSIKASASSQVAFDQLVSDALAGEVDVLIIQACNPVYSRASSDFKEALSKIPLVISVSDDLNETARSSHIALGESHFLESWGDNESVEGAYAIQQPSIEPLFDTKTFGEILLSWSGADEVDYRSFVQSVWRQKSSASNFNSWWQDKLKTGFWRESTGSGRFSPSWSGAAALLQSASKNRSSAAVELVCYESIPMGDGQDANNAWRQELADPITKVTWNNFAAISSGLASKLGIKKSDVLSLKNAAQQIELPVFIQPGLRDDVVAVAAGYGRKSAGSIGTEVGKNVFVFAGKSEAGEAQLSGIAIELAKTGGRYELATTQGHFQLHGRDLDILQRTTLDEFLANPKAAKGPKGYKPYTFSIYDDNEHVYPGNKWGMAIDLNKCTGCQACIVACYSENNIAIVGEDQVRKGRHLAWLRLDLYYSGEETQPEANFEPMLCQQCDLAPCETVCPVLATVHSSDGLNDMVYNRCVGTRYCANNCPYKVRRFNYFYYSSRLADKIEMSEESPLSLMLNPDVTVRSRGVMEKCTFCVQRIRKGVSEMSAAGIKNLPDGAIKTACQQSCPADAIEFGDLNNPQHKVTKVAEKAQAFKVLEVLNTRPSISYLPRVRNKG